jgi:hypothetical protein
VTPVDQETAAGIFAELKAVLQPYAERLVVARDEPGDFYLDAGVHPRTGKPLFFAAAQTKKNYVSFHLMPVYVYPALLDEVSDELRRRMQGKSCFNFRKPDSELVEELAGLTARGFARYEADDLLPET